MQGVCLHGQMKMNTCVEESYPLPPMPNMQHNAVVSSASLGDYDQITAQSGGLQCFTTKLGTQWSGFQPQPASVPGDLQLQVAMSQDSLRPHAPPCHSGMDKATKKRKIRSKAGEDDKDWAKNAGTLRLPEVVATLAAEGTVLEWNEAEGLFVVKDGPGFEQRFNELRYTRGKKVESAIHRPFSRMHTHFTLVRGEKWAGTGSAFKSKNEDVPKTHECSLLASDVKVSLQPSDDDAPFTISLQHFLDVTGAGDLFFKHASSSACTGSSGSLNSDADDAEYSTHGQMLTTLSLSNPGSARYHGLELEMNGVLDHGTRRLEASDVSNILGTIWDSDAKGDQAYFFMRKQGLAPFANGAIVRIRHGVVVSDADTDDSDPGLLMVVSDNNVKWKGEPHPTPEQELLGHWCCFLGQVPVTVEGDVKCGDFIGPKGDGSGFGVVCKLGVSPVVGVALVDKPEEGAAVIKTMCFAGLNAIHRGADFTECFDEVRKMSAEIAVLRSDVLAVQHSMESVTVKVGNTDVDVKNLRSRLEKMVLWLNSNATAPQQVQRGVGPGFVVMPGQPVMSANGMGMAGPARLQEIPELPVGDGHWRYAPNGNSAPGAHAWLSWAKRVSFILAVSAIVLAVSAISIAKRGPPHPKKKGGPHHPPLNGNGPRHPLDARPRPSSAVDDVEGGQGGSGKGDGHRRPRREEEAGADVGALVDGLVGSVVRESSVRLILAGSAQEK